jgi:hypothetical protein
MLPSIREEAPQKDMSMFTLSLRRAEDVRRYSISPTAPSGWEVRLEENDTLQRLDHYDDWHRVERAQKLFEREVTELAEDGWSVTPADVSQ